MTQPQISVFINQTDLVKNKTTMMFMYAISRFDDTDIMFSNIKTTYPHTYV